MPKILSLLLLLLGVIGCVNNSFGQNSNSQDSENRITWLRAYFPPVTIPYGPDAGTGFYDKITDFLIEHLPEYEHSFTIANYQRILRQIRNGREVCCASLYKTAERTRYTAFSIPVVVVLPNGVVFRNADIQRFAPYITADGAIELNRLLQDQDLQLGLAHGRKYSGGIDEILAAAKPGVHILERSGNDVFKGLLDMLMRKRIDYMLGYPVEAHYLAGQKGYNDDIVFYPVAETKDNITLGHVGCPDTPWGRTVIDRVNEILRKHRSTPEFLEFYENWLDDETAKHYRQTAMDFFAEDNK